MFKKGDWAFALAPCPKCGAPSEPKVLLNVENAQKPYWRAVHICVCENRFEKRWDVKDIGWPVQFQMHGGGVAGSG